MIKKETVVLALALLGLTGCGAAVLTPFEHFKAGKPWMNFAYKAGATVNSIGQDSTNCQVEAAQRVPQQQVVNTTPSYTTNTQTYCNNIGTQTLCNTTGGQTIGGNTYVTDSNAGLRSKVFYQCMANKSYRYINLPPCPEGADLGARTNGLPPLTKTTCYRVYPNNGWAIGNS